MPKPRCPQGWAQAHGKGREGEGGGGAEGVGKEHTGEDSETQVGEAALDAAGQGLVRSAGWSVETPLTERQAASGSWR